MILVPYSLTLPYAASVGMLYTYFTLKTETIRSFEQSINNPTARYKCRGSHSGVVEDSVLLENDTAQVGDQYPTFRKK
jgi:hypothetical protein